MTNSGKKVAVVAIKHPLCDELWLFGKRRDSGLWSLPGGHIEETEDILSGATRELFEETGLSADKFDIKEWGTIPLPSVKGQTDVTLFVASVKRFVEPTPVNDPDSEFIEFKYLNPLIYKDHMHIPWNRNIIKNYMESSMGSGIKKSQQYFLSLLSKLQQLRKDAEILDLHRLRGQIPQKEKDPRQRLLDLQQEDQKDKPAQPSEIIRFKQAAKKFAPPSFQKLADQAKKIKASSGTKINAHHKEKLKEMSSQLADHYLRGSQPNEGAKKRLQRAIAGMATNRGIEGLNQIHETFQGLRGTDRTHAFIRLDESGGYRITNPDIKLTGKIGEKPDHFAHDTFSWSDLEDKTSLNLLSRYKAKRLPADIHTSSDLIAHDTYVEQIPQGSTINIHHPSELRGHPSPARLKLAGQKLETAGHKVMYHGFPEDNQQIKKSQQYFAKKLASCLLRSRAGDTHILSKSVPPNMFYIAMDGDNAGAQVEKAALKNDIAAIREISRRIMEGSLAVINEAEKLGAEIIVHGGDDLGFLLPETKISLIDNLRNVYYQSAGFTITAGVAESIPKAVHALLYGKLHGKNQTVVWEPKMTKYIEQLAPTNPKEKILESGVLSD